ncbi:hypothetical protein BKA59DRAFT_527558 [Fusarium tricinctum]|uniref:DUF6546 domain-containing protein n=1 Tax=Fusarium tricinctum TaxID=61284 RepID=A0A8K0RYM3_9HYPO|nr:hypothetical protein BKA59DRAFT_527558 [Fusarium tricinctum]
MPDWSSLPFDIRKGILEYITTLDHIAQYSTVSEEWRCAVEEKTFRGIRIDTTVVAPSPFVVQDLHVLNGLPKRQKGLIRHIWLNIALQRYNCPDCYHRESTVQRNSNSMTMRLAISALFVVLAGWEPTKEGLTLEMNAYSPSDSEHWFRGWYFGAPGEEETLERGMRYLHFGKRHPACEDGLRRPFEVLRVIPSDLPVVRAVTKFLIRRQCRRQLDPNALLQIWRKLPSMGHIMHESWRPWGNVSSYTWDLAYGRALCHESLPTSVKRITVFEDFNNQHQFLLKKYRVLDQVHQGVPVNPDQGTIRTGGRALAGFFAKKSMQLEHLSVAFVIDVANFFLACEPGWRWEDLRSLTLTSEALARKAHRGETYQQLQAAARVALNMPKLESLTLWNGDVGEACPFVYRRYQDDVSITWRANWEFELGSEVRSAWEAVAKMHSPRRALTVETEMLRECALLSHGDAIHHLGLHSVIDSVSLEQIRKESRLPRSWLQ